MPWEWTHCCWSLTDTESQWFLFSIIWHFWLVGGAAFSSTFFTSVVLLVGGAGWQVLRDGHGLFSLLGRFIGRGAVPGCGHTPAISSISLCRCPPPSSPNPPILPPGPHCLGPTHSFITEVCFGCCAVATFALNKLQSRRNRVFYLASGTFPGPPRSPCGAGILMGARETEM